MRYNLINKLNSRRDFLKDSLLLGGTLLGGSALGLLTPLHQALALEKNLNPALNTLNEFFIEISIPGGWMTNLHLDPWILNERPLESDYFIEYLQSDLVFNQNSNSSTPLILGPTMQSLLPFTDSMTIINGIFMSSTNQDHIAQRKYAFSGDGSGLIGSMAHFIESCNEHSPYGVISENDFLGQLNIETRNPTSLLQFSENTFIPSEFDNPNSPITKSLQAELIYKTRIDKFKNDIGSIPNSDTMTQKKYKSIAYSLINNLSRSASIEISKNLDTHSNHPQSHFSQLKEAWDEVGLILNTFKNIEFKEGRSVFDNCHFYITSEFSRTPSLDGSKGTDHNPLNNSALIISPNLKGSQKIGASKLMPQAQSPSGKSYLIGQKIDYTTGELLLSKTDTYNKIGLIQPENMMVTLADILKIPRSYQTHLNSKTQSLWNLIKK